MILSDHIVISITIIQRMYKSSSRTRTQSSQLSVFSWDNFSYVRLVWIESWLDLQLGVGLAKITRSRGWDWVCTGAFTKGNERNSYAHGMTGVRGSRCFHPSIRSIHPSDLSVSRSTCLSVYQVTLSTTHQARTQVNQTGTPRMDK